MIVDRPLLRVFDPYVDSNNIMVPKGETDIYTSLRWGNYYNEAAEFEIHFPFRKNIIEMIDVFDVIQIIRPVREQFGIVLYTNVEIKENGDKEFTVKGRMLSYILNFRFSWYDMDSATGTNSMQYAIINDTPAWAMRNLVRNCINSSSSILGNSTYLFGKSSIYVNTATEADYQEIRYEYKRTNSVYSAICELAKMTGSENQIGFYMTYTSPQNNFFIYDYNQSNIFFDIESGNIKSMNFTKSIDNYITTVAIEGASSYINVSGDGVDIRNIMQYISTDSSMGSSTAERLDYAKQQIALNTPIKSLSAEIMQTNLLYLTDYNIGDVVLLRMPEFGISESLPIFGAEEIWENGYSFNLQFGDAMTNAYKKLEYEVRTK